MLWCHHYVYLPHVTEQKWDVVHEEGHSEDDQPSHEAELVDEVASKDLPEPIGLGDNALMCVEEDGDDKGYADDGELLILIDEDSE